MQILQVLASCCNIYSQDTSGCELDKLVMLARAKTESSPSQLCGFSHFAFLCFHLHTLNWLLVQDTRGVRLRFWTLVLDFMGRTSMTDQHITLNELVSHRASVFSSGNRKNDTSSTSEREVRIWELGYTRQVQSLVCRSHHGNFASAQLIVLNI